MLKASARRIACLAAALALLASSAAIGGCLGRGSEDADPPSVTETTTQGDEAGGLAAKPALEATSSTKRDASAKKPSAEKQEVSAPIVIVEDPSQDDYPMEIEGGATASGSPTIAEHEDVPVRIDSGDANIVGRLAIVIDDFGYRSEATERILSLEDPITCAVLPDARTTAEDGADAAKEGKLVILHMPMEAIDNSKSKGPGFIRSGMTEDEVDSLLEASLAKVPMARGISNHMGSRATQDAPVMLCVLEEVVRMGMFFLDSKTTPDTVASAVASQIGASVYINDLFIDSVDEVDYIVDKLWQAADKAKAEGQAVAIGHVKSSTASALEEVLPKLRSYGVEPVFLNELEPAR